MTISEIETVDLADLDYAIPCQFKAKWGGCGGEREAVWAMWFKIICDDQNCDFLYLCDPCKEIWINAPYLGCEWGHRVTPAEGIIRLEKIR